MRICVLTVLNQPHEVDSVSPFHRGRNWVSEEARYLLSITEVRSNRAEFEHKSAWILLWELYWSFTFGLEHLKKKNQPHLHMFIYWNYKHYSWIPKATHSVWPKPEYLSSSWRECLLICLVSNGTFKNRKCWKDFPIHCMEYCHSSVKFQCFDAPINGSGWHWANSHWGCNKSHWKVFRILAR